MVSKRLSLRTQRLLLRPFVDGDAAAVAALAGDPRVARMLVDIPLPFDEAAARRWLRPSWGELRLAVERSGALIGGVCYFSYPAGAGGLGYWLGHAHWGQGFASEAAAALVRHGFETERLQSFRSAHFIDNPASGRVLAHLGFHRCGRSEAWCPARGERVISIHYALGREAAGFAPVRGTWMGWMGFRPLAGPAFGQAAAQRLTASGSARHRPASSGR